MKVGEQVKTTIDLYVCKGCDSYIYDMACSFGCDYDYFPINERPVLRRTFQRVDTLESEELINAPETKTVPQEVSESWECGHCGASVPSEFDICECGDTRKWSTGPVEVVQTKEEKDIPTWDWTGDHFCREVTKE